MQQIRSFVVFVSISFFYFIGQYSNYFYETNLWERVLVMPLPAYLHIHALCLFFEIYFQLVRKPSCFFPYRRAQRLRRVSLLTFSNFRYFFLVVHRGLNCDGGRVSIWAISEYIRSKQFFFYTVFSDGVYMKFYRPIHKQY